MNSAPESRFLTQDACEALAKRVASFATGGGITEIDINSFWNGNVRWAQNQVSTSGDIRDSQVAVKRTIRGADATVVVNELDDDSLRATVKRAEQLLQFNDERRQDPRQITVPEQYPRPKIWSDTTYNLTASDRATAMRASIQPVEAAHLLSYGYLEVSAHGRAVIDNSGQSMYYPFTTAQYAVTVRDPSRLASGWAGVDWNDWGRIDAQEIASTALEKCIGSRNPVAIEPGRYTVVLEPQAVCDFFEPLMGWNMLDRRQAEGNPGRGPFYLNENQSKIGQHVLDERITVTADPMDPDLGFPPFDMNGNVFHRAEWFKNGILTNLSYDRRYAIEKLGTSIGLPNSGAFRMSGGTTSISDMIATTQRGVLVTRFSDISLVDYDSVLLSGYTRDGVWLIENGKISKPVRNLRFTDSPLFAFNQVETLGVPVRVFRPSSPAVVPAAKVRNFSFTGLTGAV